MRLDGIRILDLTRLLPGPYGTQLLADIGADVIKIEEPTVGDYARSMDIVGGDLFSMINQGKRSLALDLKTDAGRDVFLDLVAEADVVFESFRPSVVERLGIDYETCRSINDDVVYCALSGHGATGPDQDQPGHDLNYAATTGLLDMTRPSPDDPPVIPGFPVADMASGLFAAFSVVSSLLSRELGNQKGEYLDISMADVLLSFSQVVIGEALTEETPKPGETVLTGQYPCYDIYKTADGQYVTLAAIEPQFWQTFCELIKRPDLADGHFAANEDTRAQIRNAVTQVFKERPREEWEELLSDVPFAAINTVAQVVEDESFEHRGMIRRSGGTPRIGFPVQSSNGIPAGEDSVPEIGEHSGEVLHQVGYTDTQISEFRESGVI